MDIEAVDIDLSAIPTTPRKLTGPGTTVSAVWLNGELPAGTTLFIRLGNNPALHRFGPGGLFALPICPPEPNGVFATFDVATPGQSIQVILNTGGAGVPVALP